MKLANTTENNNRVAALKTVKSVHWVGEVTHDSLDKCFTAINLFQGVNSGFYQAPAVKINGLEGFYMINEDGNINYESRVIKMDENNYKIEHLSNVGFNQFESKYIELVNA